MKGLGGSGHTLAFPTAKSIMLSNEVFALGCLAYYKEEGLIVDSRNGEFAHCPYPESMGDTGYYLLHEHHQHQGLLQSRDIGRCCFFIGNTKKWLLECDYWPAGYLDLWDVYDQYSVQMSRDSLEKVKRTYPEESKEWSRKGGTTSLINQTGIHNPEYRWSDEYKETNKRAGENGAKTQITLQLGIHNPSYRSSDEYRTLRSRVGKNLVENSIGMFDPINIKRRTEKNSRPVLFVYPDGSRVMYPSRSEAIRKTGISSSLLNKLIKGGHLTEKGRFKGVIVKSCGNG